MQSYRSRGTVLPNGKDRRAQFIHFSNHPMKKSKESNVIYMSNTCSMCFEEDPPEISGHGQGNGDTNSEVMYVN